MLAFQAMLVFSSMKPNYEGFAIYPAYKNIDGEISLEGKIFSGTLMTICGVISLPVIALGEVYTIIKHAASADGSFCTCISCENQRDLEKTALSRLLPFELTHQYNV